MVKSFVQKILDSVIRQYMKQFTVIMLDNFCKEDDNGLEKEDVDLVRRKLFNLSIEDGDANGSPRGPGSRQSTTNSSSRIMSPEIRITDDHWNLFPD